MGASQSSSGALREDQTITPQQEQGTSVQVSLADPSTKTPSESCIASWTAEARVCVADWNQFSPSLINRLASPPPASSPSQGDSTDDIIRRRLAAESAHIRQQEADILKQISAALEKENLDKEKPGMSSEVLGRDIEEVREKVERMRKERSEKETQGVRSAREGVRRCYL